MGSGGPTPPNEGQSGWYGKSTGRSRVANLGSKKGQIEDCKKGSGRSKGQPKLVKARPRKKVHIEEKDKIGGESFYLRHKGASGKDWWISGKKRSLLRVTVSRRAPEEIAGGTSFLIESA